MTLADYKGAISAQQAKFAELYIKYRYNGRRAVEEAGYKAKNLYVAASRLLTDQKVKAYVDALSAQAADLVLVSIETQQKRLEWINNADINDYVIFDGKKIRWKSFDEMTPEQRYAIKGIKNGKNGIEITLHDKNWSLDMLNRNVGFYEKDNKQRGEVPTGVAVLLPDNTRAKIIPLTPDEPAAPTEKADG